MQKKAWRNDWQGSAGYEAVGQHVTSGMANGLSLLIGVGELHAAYKGVQGLNGAFRLGITATDVGLTADDLIKDVSGLKETPMEMMLPEKGKSTLNNFKLFMSAKGATTGLLNLKTIMRTGNKTEELAPTIFQTGKAANDTYKGLQEKAKK